ncbi:DUF3427 domain-containing protein [Marinobacter vinifirmus]|uniref:DUF3427 domain-containing protein n=1 Tax=Marinobacter vinifirmus TaxID=355591 RepID=A0A558BD63_9GAMM|nr:DUF3427 domain-containing protein [Marinobacter vinifirmus]TVT34440.1 MAG: DUF3427 domain-containing protein [Marinobacter vinifirmus]
MQQTGIYEQLITKLIESRLDRDKFYVGERQLNSAEASVWLSRFLSNILEFAIEAVPSGDDRLQEQIELSNQLLMWLKSQISDEGFLDENLLDSQGRILTALYELENPVAANLKQYVEDIFPLTGLTQSELFSGSNAGLSLESELKREILSADKIYWLVSFIKWAGIRIFRKELEAFTASGRELKIITTSYMGATDAKAVEYLASLPNTEVKLSYNTERERLHAKSYLFLRNTGFHTGYIGSSNLSRSALTNGLEWNLKITSQEIPHIINKSLSTFETYWASEDFERFDGQAESTEKLNRALKQQKGLDAPGVSHYFEITPFPHLKKLCQAGFSWGDASNRQALMCHYDFWQKTGPELEFDSLAQSLAELSKLGLEQELADVLDWKLARTKHEQPAMPELQEVPLRLHARYSREQILVGFGAMTFEHQPPSREGVYVIQDQNIELLFVTLDKNEKQFSPTTMYHDYAINEQLFHWQSQNSARPDRGKGKDYIQHQAINKRLLLFVREQAKDEYGRTMGFVNYGEVNYVSHTGSQPMSITWQLRTPMPNFMWQQAAKLAVA